MRSYLLKRILRSIFSLIAVVAIVFVLIYSLIPRQNIFNNDSAIVKYSGDNRTNYIYTNYEKFGYLDYVSLSDYCVTKYNDVESTEYFQCNKANSENPNYAAFETEMLAKNYIVEWRNDGKPYAYKNINSFMMMINWFGNILDFDSPNRVSDADLASSIGSTTRGLYVGKDWNGNVAVMCTGCIHKYQLYFDGTFPFIHSNWLTIDLGTSFPTFSGKKIVSVIANPQGENVIRDLTFPTGLTAPSAIIEHTCEYKPYLNALEQLRFTDNYSDCLSAKSDRSMIGTSFLIGFISVIIAYFIGVPLGMLMARYKDKWVDKLGMAYIIFIISVPSLAYIFMFSRIGASMGFPIKFSALGAHNTASYFLPIISLALPSISGLMMWVRRYMIDQSQSDYVKFARSKGLSESEISNKHILRNAIIPITHGIPGDIIGALVGAIITERVYAVPGMGKMLTDSINNYNNSMIVALTFIYTGLSIIALILGDIVFTIVDPRISFEETGGRK